MVQPEIAKLTKACWYDRAGFGWSDPANSLNTVDSMARDLHRLLQLHRFGRRTYSSDTPLAAGMCECLTVSTLER